MNTQVTQMVEVAEATIELDIRIEICSLTRPTALLGRILIGPGNYDVWKGRSYNPEHFSYVRGWGFNW